MFRVIRPGRMAIRCEDKRTAEMHADLAISVGETAYVHKDALTPRWRILSAVRLICRHWYCLPSDCRGKTLRSMLTALDNQGGRVLWGLWSNEELDAVL